MQVASHLVVAGTPTLITVARAAGERESRGRQGMSDIVTPEQNDGDID